MKSLFKKKKDIAPLEDNIIELDKNKTTIPYKETGECISQNVLPLNAKIKEFRKTEISLLKPSFNLEKEGDNKKNIEDEILKQTPENFSQLISEEHLKIQKMLSSFEAEIDTPKMFCRYDERYFINFNFFDYILDDKEKIKDEIKKYIIILVNHLNSLKWKISSNYNDNYICVFKQINMFLIIHVDNINVVFYPQNTKFKKLCLNSMIHFSINIQDKSFVQYVHSSIIKEYCKKQLLGITSKMEKNLLSNITEKYKIIYDTDYEEDEDDFIETSTNKNTTCVHNKSLMSLDDAEKLIRDSNNINKEQ